MAATIVKGVAKGIGVVVPVVAKGVGIVVPQIYKLAVKPLGKMIIKKISDHRKKSKLKRRYHSQSSLCDDRQRRNDGYVEEDAAPKRSFRRYNSQPSVYHYNTQTSTYDRSATSPPPPSYRNQHRDASEELAGSQTCKPRRRWGSSARILDDGYRSFDNSIDKDEDRFSLSRTPRKNEYSNRSESELLAASGTPKAGRRWKKEPRCRTPDDGYRSFDNSIEDDDDRFSTRSNSRTPKKDKNNSMERTLERLAADGKRVGKELWKSSGRVAATAAMFATSTPKKKSPYR